MGLSGPGTPAADRPKRIGVFGGAFDPIHTGHIKVALFALEAADLDFVLVIPALDPWLRPDEPSASPEDRASMVELAVEGIEGLEMSRVDLDRPGATYTVDTLADLRRLYGPGASLVLILGADSALGMDRWKRASELPGMCEMLVIGRPGQRWPSDLPPGHPAAHARFVEGPMVNVSATEVRRRLASGQPIRYILPGPVERYIREHGLYGAGGDRERE